MKNVNVMLGIHRAAACVVHTLPECNDQFIINLFVKRSYIWLHYSKSYLEWPKYMTAKPLSTVYRCRQQL